MQGIGLLKGRFHNTAPKTGDELCSQCFSGALWVPMTVKLPFEPGHILPNRMESAMKAGRDIGRSWTRRNPVATSIHIELYILET